MVLNSFCFYIKFENRNIEHSLDKLLEMSQK